MLTPSTVRGAGGASLHSQLDFARTEAARVSDPELRRALLAAAQRLGASAAALGKGKARAHASNYAIVLERT